MGMGNNLTNIGVLEPFLWMTDQVAANLIGESMLKVGELQEDFLLSCPVLKLVTRIDAYASMTNFRVQSFIAMEDGKFTEG